MVKRTAEIIIDSDKQFTLKENQYTYIALGQVHGLTNPITVPLEIIEVKSGGHLGKDDIIRIQDSYGKN